MKNLLRVFLIVLVLVLLSVLKRILDKYSPASIIFHYNLITCIQYFLLIIVLSRFILQWFFTSVLKKKLSPEIFWIVLLSLFACSEAFFYYSLRNAEKTPAAFHRLLTEYYLTYEINFPPLSYDSVLTYTLKKKSVYEHDNIEFSNYISVNAIGLRDDESALTSPEVICLGDSYTMGWGVEHDMAYPKQLQKLSGLKVLNAGVTSYGTAREALLLNRLDTSAVKYLIIQYCYNDWTENKKFLDSGRYVPSGSQKTLDRTFKSYRYAKSYFPFKYSLTLLRMYLRNIFMSKTGKEREKAPVAWVYSLDYVQPAADAFLKVLYAGNINFRKLKIFIIDTNRYPVFEHHLLDAVESKLKSGNYSDEFRQSIRIVKFPELNNQKYFYPLDNHLNYQGHALIAARLTEALREFSQK